MRSIVQGRTDALGTLCTGSEHKFNKMEIENWLPIEHSLGYHLDLESTVITTILCSSVNGEILLNKVL